jgi:hypothetical protein
MEESEVERFIAKRLYELSVQRIDTWGGDERWVVKSIWGYLWPTKYVWLKTPYMFTSEPQARKAWEFRNQLDEIENKIHRSAVLSGWGSYADKKTSKVL